MELPKGLLNHTETIKGKDDNEIKLYITRPAETSVDLPGILHIHGGGMAILTADDPNCIYWRHKLASTGLIVVGVELEILPVYWGSTHFLLGLTIVYLA